MQGLDEGFLILIPKGAAGILEVVLAGRGSQPAVTRMTSKLLYAYRRWVVAKRSCAVAEILR